MKGAWLCFKETKKFPNVKELIYALNVKIKLITLIICYYD